MSPGWAAPPGTAGATGPTTPGARLRVAFVDDDTVIRVGTPMLLDSIDSAGGFASVEELLQAHPPADIVLLDLHLTGTGRVDVTQGANAIGVVTKAGYRVLIYTNERRREVLAGCLAAGAHGVVHKAEPLERVADALAAVSRDEVVITTALAGLAELVERWGELPSLTPRQRQVLSRRARGEQYQQIASHLGIGVRTVEGHLADIGARFAQYLRHHSAADLERYLGVGPGDVLHRP